jgi:hypothetical protein
MKTEPKYKRGKYIKTNKRTLKKYVSLTKEENDIITATAKEQKTSISQLFRDSFFNNASIYKS